MSKSRASGKADRSAQFKAALALAQMTAEAWADSHRISTHHLYSVLRGDRESARLDEQIDSFIMEHLPQGAGT